MKVHIIQDRLWGTSWMNERREPPSYCSQSNEDLTRFIAHEHLVEKEILQEFVESYLETLDSSGTLIVGSKYPEHLEENSPFKTIYLTFIPNEFQSDESCLQKHFDWCPTTYSRE